LLLLDNPFWKFSLRVYAQPEVAAECLDLQRVLSINVNLLLFCSWVAIARRIALDAADVRLLESEIHHWHGLAVLPLREIRDTLKSPSEMQHQAVQAFRKTDSRARTARGTDRAGVVIPAGGELIGATGDHAGSRHYCRQYRSAPQSIADACLGRNVGLGADRGVAGGWRDINRICRVAIHIVTTPIVLRVPQALVTAEEIKMTYYSICDRGCFGTVFAAVCRRRYQRFLPDQSLPSQ